MTMPTYEAETAHDGYDGWLQSRTRVMRTLVQLSHRPATDDGALASFSETLLDYVSHGHSRIYPRFLEAADGRRAADIYVRLTQTTESILVFSEAQERGEALDRDRVSEVGVALAEHFELEDALVRGAARFDA